MNKILLERTISAFPLSIGTSLPMETLFTGYLPPYDPNRIHPGKVDIMTYEIAYINIATLFRNVVSSIPSKGLLDCNYKDMLNVILSEVDVIASLFANEGNNACKVIFYTNSYKKVTLQRRKDTTLQQMHYTAILNDVIKYIPQMTNIEEFDRYIETPKRKGLIFTHCPYDLLSYKNFSSLQLLESNTGLLKSRFHWYSKYAKCGERDLSNIPFNEKMLKVFGDRVMIQPQDIKLRRLILDIAERRKWNQMSTNDKITLSLNLEITEPFVLQYLKAL